MTSQCHHYVIITMLFQDKKSKDIYFEDLDIISGKDFGLRAKFAADQTEATEAIDNFQINAKGKGGSTLDEIWSQVM